MKAVIDIETIPGDRNSFRDVALKGKFSLPETEAPISDEQDEQFEQAYRKTALDGTWGRLVCIAIIYLSSDDSVREAGVIYGDYEKGVLSRFWEEMKKHGVKQFIAHNGLGFDLPFLWNRSVVHQVKPSVNFRLAKFRTDFVYDTMAVWANWEGRKFPRLDALAAVLGVGGKTGSGGDIFQLWETRKYKEVASYCFNDTYLAYACYCKMNFRLPNALSTFQPDFSFVTT